MALHTRINHSGPPDGPNRGMHAATPRAMPQAQHPMLPQQFAQKRLAQLTSMMPQGQQMPHVQGGAAQQWRSLSPIMGALMAAHGGHPDQYQTPQNIDPRILALVQHILGGTQGQFEPGGHYGQQPPSSIRYGPSFGDSTRPFGP